MAGPSPTYRAGTGLALPEGVRDSRDVDARLGEEPGWVERRTGIRERRIAPERTGVSALAVPAGERALRAAGLPGRDLDLLLLATSTPDRPLPPTAPLVAHRLGLTCGAVDVARACTGFLHALVLADCYLAGGGRAALVIGANILSRRVDWLLPHQANRRMIEHVAEEVGIPPARTLVNVDRAGNTSAATIPILLAESVAAGRVKPGQTLLMTAAGAGLTAGAVLLRW